MHKISQNRILRIFLTIILSITLTTGIMYQQKQEVEAAVAIPLVAIPIIKAMISAGVTFATVDAMLEAYNVFTGSNTFNTISGDVNDRMTQQFNDMMDKIEVQELLNHYFPGGQKPDPNDPEWNNYKNLTLGTIAVSVADKWDELKTWMQTKFKKGENSIYEVELGLGDNDIKYETNSFPMSMNLPKGWKVEIVKVPNTPNVLNINYRDPSNVVKMSYQDYSDTNVKPKFQITERLNGTNKYLDIKTNYTRPDRTPTSHTYSILMGTVPYDFPETQKETLVPYIGSDVLEDPNHTWTNTQTEQQEVIMPLPLEIVEYDDDQQKWVINPTREFTRDEAEEMLSPWIDKKHTDIIQEQPVPTPTPGTNPNPNPNPDPNPNPNPDPTPDPYDPSQPGDAPPGTGTPTEPGTGEEPPPDPDEYKIPDLFRFIFWIIILIIKLILKMIEFVIKFFRIPANPHIIPKEAQDVVNYFKHAKIPGFDASFYTIVTRITAILLAFRFTKIFVNYFKGSAEGYEKESEKIIQQKYREMKTRNKTKGKFKI